MNEISSDVKTHVIITWSKGEYLINDIQHREILKLGLNDSITINSCTLFGKSIAEIITVTEKNRRDNDVKITNEDSYYKNFNINQVWETLTPERKKEVLIKMKEGFLKHLEGKKMSKNAQAILKNMDDHIR